MGVLFLWIPTPILCDQGTVIPMIISSAQGWLDHAARLAAYGHRWFHMVTGAFRESRFLYHARGKARRFWLVHFQKAYVLEQRAAREGACRQCGTCCNLLFTCPRLTKRSNCMAYGTCRPEVCKRFPIDHRDIQEIEICGGKCGFHFTPSAPSAYPLGGVRKSSRTAFETRGDGS
jgi:hypothetical protein